MLFSNERDGWWGLVWRTCLNWNAVTWPALYLNQSLDLDCLLVSWARWFTIDGVTANKCAIVRLPHGSAHDVLSAMYLQAVYYTIQWTGVSLLTIAHCDWVNIQYIILYIHSISISYCISVWYTEYTAYHTVYSLNQYIILYISHYLLWNILVEARMIRCSSCLQG